MKKCYVFSSDHCAPCKEHKAQLKNMGVQFQEMNVDNGGGKLAQQWHIRSLPTTIIADMVLDNEVPLQRFIGTGAITTKKILEAMR